MNVIKNVYLAEGVAVISFENIPADINFLADLFDKVAKASINVDMISQTAPRGKFNSISFTVKDEDVGDIIALIKSLGYESLMPIISPGQVKIGLYGDEMPSKCGVASDVFVRLKKENINILLITTSDVDISIVVSNTDGDKAFLILKEAYMNNKTKENANDKLL